MEHPDCELFVKNVTCAWFYCSLVNGNLNINCGASAILIIPLIIRRKMVHPYSKWSLSYGTPNGGEDLNRHCCIFNTSTSNEHCVLVAESGWASDTAPRKSCDNIHGVPQCREEQRGKISMSNL